VDGLIVPDAESSLQGAHVELKDISKSFGGTRALEGVSLTVARGSIHALVGENGAGKSTLGKIIAGAHAPDSGQLLLDGEPVRFHSPRDAIARGVILIAQELAIVPALTVAQNVFLGVEPRQAGFQRRSSRRRRYRELAASAGFELDGDANAGALRTADQQKVEIMRALSRNAQLIVMDEPTAALSAAEVARLFDVIRALRADGAAVLFISHRLEEVFEICQRVTVMRDGSTVLASELAGMTADDLVRAMVGRDMPQRTAGERSQPGDEVLRVERLTREGVFTDISLQVRAGEIVALAGLVGSGRSEVARAIFGIDRYDAGTVTVRGQKLRKASPTAAMAAGIGYVPEDRRQQGLVMDMSIQQNVALASLARLRQGGLIRSAAERAFATDWAQRLRLKYGRLTDPVSMLSGGNQQKVVLAKWLGRGPALLIVDEPTRGIDIATKADVHELLVRLAGEGVAILMISSELPEVLSVGDRILVMREGRLTAEYSHADATEEKIMSAATGQLERTR
jgi:rhamnose transport system ATP-binding protein